MPVDRQPVGGRELTGRWGARGWAPFIAARLSSPNWASTPSCNGGGVAGRKIRPGSGSVSAGRLLPDRPVRWSGCTGQVSAKRCLCYRFSTGLWPGASTCFSPPGPSRRAAFWPDGSRRRFCISSFPSTDHGRLGVFVAHWRPDLVCFAESELWPNLIGEARRSGCPVVLVNGRMSDRSFRRWRRLPGFIRPLLANFDVILAQTTRDGARFEALGAPAVAVPGNLKFDGAPPPADQAEADAIRDLVGSRPVWVAASTHAGEDDLCCAVHAALKSRHPDLLTVLVPRKLDRCDAILERSAQLGLKAVRRSKGQLLTSNTDIYVGDTMGELGLFYRLGPIAFVGKSLVERGGGQNPIEAAKLGSAILHGPHVANFEDVYATLDATGGAVSVRDVDHLGATLAALLADPSRVAEMGQQAAVAVGTLVGATVRTMEAIEPSCAAALARRTG